MNCSLREILLIVVVLAILLSWYLDHMRLTKECVELKCDIQELKTEAIQMELQHMDTSTIFEVREEKEGSKGDNH